MTATALTNETGKRPITRSQINKLVSVYLEQLFKREDEIGYTNMSTFKSEADLIRSTVQDKDGSVILKTSKFQKKHALFQKAKASLFYLNEKYRVVICCYVYSLDGKGTARPGLSDASLAGQLNISLCSYQHSKKQAYKKLSEILEVFNVYESL